MYYRLTIQLYRNNTYVTMAIISGTKSVKIYLLFVLDKYIVSYISFTETSVSIFGSWACVIIIIFVTYEIKHY